MDWEGNKHGHGNKHDVLLLPANFLLGSRCPDLTPRGQSQVNATHAAQPRGMGGGGGGGGEWGLRGLEGTRGLAGFQNTYSFPFKKTLLHP